jgi:hypothetical protein
VLESVLVSVVVLPAAIVIQATAIDLTVRFVAIVLGRGYAGRSFWHNITVMMGVMLILLVALLAQVAVWAGAFVLCNALPDFPTAYYHSAVNFTTLGYGDIVMTPRWRLLGPLEAANGVLMFGMSAAAMVTVSNRLVDLRLKGQHPGNARESHDPPRRLKR